MKKILWMEEILHQLGTMKGTYETLQIMGLEWEKTIHLPTGAGVLHRMMGIDGIEWLWI